MSRVFCRTSSVFSLPNDTRICFNATGCFIWEFNSLPRFKFEKSFFLLFLYFAHKSTLWIIGILQQFEAFKESVESGKRATQKMLCKACLSKPLDLLAVVINFVSAFLLDFSDFAFPVSAAFFSSHWSAPARCWCWETSEWSMGFFGKGLQINVQCQFFIESLVCCRWKLYNFGAWLPGKFLRDRCSWPRRRVFWKTVFLWNGVNCLFVQRSHSKATW